MSTYSLKPAVRSALFAMMLLGTTMARAEDLIHSIVALTHEGSCMSALGY